MPLIDMPLQELQQYRGTNPRPDDYDAYWERALAEMKAVDPRLDLSPAKFQTGFADCFDLTFTGVRGARIYAKYARPKKLDGPVPGLLLFHGYSGASCGWTGLLQYVAAGMAVAALDCRGQGGRSEDTGGHKGTTYEGHFMRGVEGNPDDMLMRHIFLDTAQLAGIVHDLPEVDGSRLMAHGGSQGGGLTIACAGLEPRITRLVPMCPFLCDYQRVWEMDLAKSAYDEITYHFRNFDPRHLREREFFTKLGYVDVQNMAPRIRGELLMATGLMDTVCPPSTQYAFFNKVLTGKEVVLYPDFAHEDYPGFSDTAYQFLCKE